MNSTRIINVIAFNIMYFGFIILLVLFLASCGGVPPEPSNSDIGTTPAGHDINRFVDTEAGVVCWSFSTGGISCLPLKDTLLIR